MSGKPPNPEVAKRLLVAMANYLRLQRLTETQGADEEECERAELELKRAVYQAAKRLKR